MPLPRAKLGPYEVASAIAPAYGEVYRAKDTRLDRTVAVKDPAQSSFFNPTLAAFTQARPSSSLTSQHCTFHDSPSGWVDCWLWSLRRNCRPLGKRSAPRPSKCCDRIKLRGLERATRAAVIRLKPGILSSTPAEESCALICYRRKANVFRVRKHPILCLEVESPLHPRGARPGPPKMRTF